MTNNNNNNHLALDELLHDKMSDTVHGVCSLNIHIAWNLWSEYHQNKAYFFMKEYQRVSGPERKWVRLLSAACWVRSVSGCVSLSNSVNTYLWFDLLCVIWGHFITLSFDHQVWLWYENTTGWQRSTAVNLCLIHFHSHSSGLMLVDNLIEGILRE